MRNCWRRIRLASSARRVTSPLLHLILSVPEGEDFTAVERDEALGVFLGREQALGVVDPHHRVARGVKDQQRGAHLCQRRVQRLAAHVLDKGAPDAEPAPFAGYKA